MRDRTTKGAGVGSESGALGGRWIYGVAGLGAFHVALFATLQARPGAIGVVLWTWGPVAVVTAAAGMLAGALVSASRNRLGWTRKGAAGLAGLCLILATVGVYRTYPSSHDERPSRVEFRLPLDGAVTVAWGGPDPRVNYHVGAPPERWGYDLLVTVARRSYRGDGLALTDYYVYDRPVYAPSDGRVVDVRDGDPDERPGRRIRLGGGGNRIVLEVAPGEYLFLVHLRSGTIRVAPGEHVSRGDLLARVGNSGNSSEPHLHVHLQDTPVVDAGEAIPFFFSNYVAGGVHVARGIPTGGVRRGRRYVGDVVRSAEAGP